MLNNIPCFKLMPLRINLALHLRHINIHSTTLLNTIEAVRPLSWIKQVYIMLKLNMMSLLTESIVLLLKIGVCFKIKYNKTTSFTMTVLVVVFKANLEHVYMFRLSVSVALTLIR